MSKFEGNEAETTIAVDPSNSDWLFSGAIHHGPNGTSLFASHSSNRGATWTQHNILTGGPGGDSLPRFIADPQAIYDDYGNLFLAYMTGSRAQFGSSSAVGNTTISDNTRSWATNMWVGYDITVTSGEISKIG